jgi:cell fate regulator YaaT (PSP1 superfamily)
MSDIEEGSEEILPSTPETPGHSGREDGERLDPLQDEIKRQEGRFKDGQELIFIRVRFPGNAKSFPFLMGKRRLNYGQKVLALSDRGMAVGYVNSFPYTVGFDSSMLPIRTINKIATEEDLAKQREDYKREKQFERICLDAIEKYKLDMNLTHVEFTQFGKKAVFYFTAPARVDFRELVKDLVGQLKLRIELRQISLRDRSAAVGGIGPCGRELCCSSFLTKYGNVNIKMAKNQNLSLIYNKLNGVCGQLKCCLQYEDEVYFHKRKKLPQEGSFIQTKNGDKGRVERLHLLPEQFDMLTESGAIRRYALHQFHYKGYLPESYQLPQIDHVSDETAVVVGLEEEQQIKIRKFEEDIERIKSEAPKFTDNVWRELKGEEVVSTPVEAPAQTNQQHGHQHGQHQGPRQERHHHNNNQRHHNHHRHHNDRKPGHGRNGNSNGNSNNEE